MKTKSVRPVLVESKERTNIFNHDNKLIFDNLLGEKWSLGKYQELILISLENEKIEEGELVYHFASKECCIYPNGGFPSNKHCAKVITHRSQILPEYISKFIEQYNNGCVEDVEIEMDYFPTMGKIIGDEVFPGPNIYYPKLTNNFVTIIEKESFTYTEKEVLKYCLEALEMGFDLSRYPFPRLNEKSGKQYFIDWFNQNKKK